jgi:Domain of unknown function (DUF1844)
MSEQNKPFVVTDRRKFTLDGTPRPDADPSPAREPRDESPAQMSSPFQELEAAFAAKSPGLEPAPESTAAPEPDANPDLPPAPTAAEMEQANAAYKQTSERLDTAVRAANPGVEHPPEMSFEQILHSIYMTTIMQLGGTTQEGQQPKVDLMGARQSIDMLGILADKTRGNLNPAEAQLMDNALFEVRMGFLEVTQALARQAATRQPPPPGSGTPGRPSIVR